MNNGYRLDTVTLSEKMEKQLEHFEQRRGYFEQELVKMRDGLKSSIDLLFEQISKEITPMLEETDSIIEGCVKDFRHLMNRKKEMDEIQKRLTPVFELLGGTQTNAQSTS